jgi:hypothetical protein
MFHHEVGQVPLVVHAQSRLSVLVRRDGAKDEYSVLFQGERTQTETLQLMRQF